MPKGFSDREKEVIRANLLEKGRELFGRYGLKKTNIEDLTRAVGISKGAFYDFYPSKELLFFDILEQFEAELHQTFYQKVFEPGVSPRQRFKELMIEMVVTLDENPILKFFTTEEYAQLLRKLPPERVQKHVANDQTVLARFITENQCKGFLDEVDIKLVTGLYMTLFLVGLHSDEFDSQVFTRTVDMLADLIANYMFKE